MIDGKTKNGFKYKIDERVLDDWRLLKNIALSESDDQSEKIRGASNLVSLLLGDQEPAMMDFIAKKNNGFVPSEKVIEMITDILTSVKELKNS